jgi:serine protease Do
MKNFLRFLILLLLIALVAALTYVWRGKHRIQTRSENFTPSETAALPPNSVNILERLNEEYTKLGESVIPSVVSITTSKTIRERAYLDPFEFFFGNGSGEKQRETSMGSGVIISKEGHIVTNNHVLNGTDDIEVLLSDGRKTKANIIGSDTQFDLAVLKINLPNIKPLMLGDSDKVRVGQIVFAIGNPFGLNESVSQGIISAKDRRAISDSDVEFFQTDTAINPGNSGGPLVNIKGQIVGINTAIYSESGGNQGIGFAIPSNAVKRAVKSLISKGRVIRGYLGIRSQSVTAAIAKQLKLDNPSGAMVTDVTPDSPAEKAGIISGDIIIKLGQSEIRDPEGLIGRIAELDIGTKVVIEFFREGKNRTASVTIAEQPATLSTNRSADTSPNTTVTFAGIKVTELTNHRNQVTSGVTVTDVDEDSPAADQIQPGDTIDEVNRQPIKNLRDFARTTNQLDSDSTIVLGVIRNHQRFYIILN